MNDIRSHFTLNRSYLFVISISLQAMLYIHDTNSTCVAINECIHNVG